MSAESELETNHPLVVEKLIKLWPAANPCKLYVSNLLFVGDASNQTKEALSLKSFSELSILLEILDVKIDEEVTDNAIHGFGENKVNSIFKKNSRDCLWSREKFNRKDKK